MQNLVLWSVFFPLHLLFSSKNRNCWSFNFIRCISCISCFLCGILGLFVYFASMYFVLLANAKHLFIDVRNTVYSYNRIVLRFKWRWNLFSCCFTHLRLCGIRILSSLSTFFLPIFFNILSGCLIHNQNHS